MNQLIFQPVRNFGNILPWNQRLRELFAAVNEIITRLNAPEGGGVAESVAVEPVTEAPPVVVEEAQEPVELTEIEKLRAKCDELGIEYDKRIGVAKLEALIDAAKNQEG